MACLESVACASVAVAAPAPHVTGYTPTPVASSVAQTITVLGSSFNGPQPVQSVNGKWVAFGTASNATASSFVWTVILPSSGGVSLTVQNKDGKRSSSFTIMVLVPPSIPAPAPLIATCAASPPPAIAPSGSTTAAVSFAAPTVTGGVSPVTSTCTPSSGSLFPIGTTPVQCVARDAVGATSTCNLTVTVNLAPTTTCQDQTATNFGQPLPCVYPPPPPPPPSGTVSPDCTSVLPGGATLIAGDLAVWSLLDDESTIRNSVHVNGGYGSILEWTAQHTIQTLGTDNNWYVFSGGDAGTWSPTGAGDPCAAPTPPPTSPALCQDLTATNYGNALPCFYPSLTVAWNPQANAGGYEVDYSTVSGVYDAHLDVGAATQAVLTNVVNGKTYFVVIRAYDAAHAAFSPNSVEVSGVAR